MQQRFKILIPIVLLALTGPAYAADGGVADATKAATPPPTTLPSTAAATTDIPGAVATGKGIFSAFKGGKYREGIAGVIVLLLFLWRRFASKLVVGKLSPWWVGFVAVLLGYLGSIPEALAVESWSWSTFVSSGLLTSAEAMFVWAMAAKRLLPKVFGDVPKKEI